MTVFRAFATPVLSGPCAAVPARGRVLIIAVATGQWSVVNGTVKEAAPVLVANYHGAPIAIVAAGQVGTLQRFRAQPKR